MPAAANLVEETTTSTGTGDLTLVAASGGKRRFSAAFGTGATVDAFDYFISHETLTEWERGTGHMSDADTLVRDTVAESSDAGAAVDFSAGSKVVVNDVPSARQQIAWQGLAADATAAAGRGYFVDTLSGPITLTLPASPSVGDTVAFEDAAGNFHAGNLTLGANGNKIMGSADDCTVAVQYASAALVYSGSTFGWRLT